MWYRNVFKLSLKLFLILSLFCCGIFCGISFASNDNHDHFVFQKPAPYDHSVNQVQDSDDQALTLNNDMFGLRGPFSLQAVYSKLFGMTVEGTYTQVLGLKDAALLELDLGGKQRRIAGTWGHALTANQLFKITAENLSQNLDFDFVTGKIRKWMYQNAIGGSYAYLIKNGLFNDINLNAYYSKANSKNLPSIDYTSGTGVFRDFRRIAGGVDKSASVGVHLLPTPATLIGVTADYDDVSYKMRNDLSAKRDEDGLGATVSLDQLINDHVKFNLLASHRKPYQDYKAEVDWLVNSAPGSSLELGVLGERVIGNLGTRNDTQRGVNFAYTWGGNPTAKPMLYGVPKADTGISGLRDWVSNPAVRMEQVLALKDEKIQQIGTITTPSPKLASNNEDTIKIHPGETKQIDVTQYFASHSDDKNASKIVYTVKALPKGHDLKYQDGKLIINQDSFTKKDLDQKFVIDFIPANTNAIPSLSMVSLVLKVERPHPLSWPPAPNPYYLYDHPITIYLTAGQVYSKQSFVKKEQTHNNQIIVNVEWDKCDLDWSKAFTGFDSLKIVPHVEVKPYYPDPPLPYYHDYILTYSAPAGIPQSAVGRHTAYIAPCIPQEYFPTLPCNPPLPITIIVGVKPTITIPTLTFEYKKPVNEDITQYIKSMPGYSLNTVTADLSEYGLKLNFDQASQKVTITGTPTKTTETERTIPISASNRFGKTDSNFKLDILSPPIKLKDIGDKAGQVDKYMNPIPLEDYFEVPVGSPKIDGWEIEAKSQDRQVDIKGLDQIKNYFGLTIKDGYLQGKLKDVKQHAPYVFYISARNAEGESIDKDGNAASAKMNLTVLAEDEN
jgi:hypothetical protein